MKGKLILENGSEYDGVLFGKKTNIEGEIVFNTSMVGYPESLTDPSYKNQILVLTYPSIGNYGVPSDKINDKSKLLEYFESSNIQISGLIISDYCEDHSHWNSNKTLSEWMNESDIPGLYGIDTRQLTKIIRDKGTMKAKIIYDTNQPLYSISTKNLVAEVSCDKVHHYNRDGQYKIIVIDCGIKNNIIRKLLRIEDLHLKVVPYNYKINEDYDGIFISNGPGDPKDCKETIETIRILLENNKPILGICLGNQLLGLASGCDTIKLKYGNRSVNQPVIDLRTKKCYITPQNHGYAIDSSTLTKDWTQYYINANDMSNEGIIHVTKPFVGVQFHPEACGGPTDTDFLFDQFVARVKSTINHNYIDRSFSYYYQIKNRNISKVLILGSGGLSIGQAGEFDYSGSQAIKALKEENIEVILINPNIATVQTSKNMADKIYYLSVDKDTVKNIIEKEKPDSIMINFGGQTALNCAIDLYNAGILHDNNVKILGTSIDSIVVSEDRTKFADLMEEIGEPVAKRFTITSITEIEKAVEIIGFPMILRNGFALGGLGSCFINNLSEMKLRITELLKYSVSVLVEQSIKGWKEIEYEIVRDYSDNCIAVCNMENFDPLGVHTGDSIVVAPSQTLSNNDYYRLRNSAIKIAKKLNIVGECNVQFALDPESERYIIIELNPRLSRSSALASKATGYPLAYVAAKILLGKDLIDLRNKVTKKTTACYEPSLDYIVVKMPRWEFKKFKYVNKHLDSSMKSVGEVMAIGRSFEETVQKAIRMIDDNSPGFCYTDDEDINIDDELKNPSHNRIQIIAKAYDAGYSVKQVYQLTKIDKWFLHKLYNIHRYKQIISNQDVYPIPKDMLITAKKLGFSDKFIARLLQRKTSDIYESRVNYNIMPWVKQIDTTAGEFPAETNYLYLTYNGNEHDVNFDKNGVIVLGCGCYRIGSSVEFDWCAVSCINTLKKNKEYAIVINYNPETVSTDYDVSDRLYFEEISSEVVTDIYNIEKSKGIIISVGGQTPNNIALDLHKSAVNILGTSPTNIDRAEDRHKFSQLLDTLGVDQPKWKELDKIDEAIQFCENVNYPVLIRPSYVLSGAAMKVAENQQQLISYLNIATKVSKDCPVVISKFITDAKEIEIDAVADKGKLINYAISEHVENAGIHSGDATLILPAHKLYLETIKRIKKVTRQIAKNLYISGPFNIQFISKDNEIKVIECNLRASRSFPFVSKTYDINFIEMATNIMLNTKYSIANLKFDELEYVAIKVPVFSFARLPNVDPVLGVEMVSTGEVAAFGYDVKETYIKALMASGFKLPKKNILISIGDEKFKYEFLSSIRILQKLGYNLYGTDQTYLFSALNNIDMKKVDMIKVIDMLERSELDLVINIPTNMYNSDNSSSGYVMRRKSIDSNIPLITNIKCARLFVASLREYKANGIDYKSWDEYIMKN
jgi:carbamoyl-phosphate synthase large subunit/carbamoyl-phosphate synthase small subunit